MRKLMISVLAGSLTVAGASAQVKAYKPSKPMEGNTVAYALPRSVVRVQVVAERESVRVGPYARFAQKLLGVMAPLADKDIYTIQSATLCAAQEADPAEVYALDNPDKSPLRIYDVTPEGFVAASAAGQKPLPPAWGLRGSASRACSRPLRGGVLSGQRYLVRQGVGRSAEPRREKSRVDGAGCRQCDLLVAAPSDRSGDGRGGRERGSARPEGCA